MKILQLKLIPVYKYVELPWSLQGHVPTHCDPEAGRSHPSLLPPSGAEVPGRGEHSTEMATQFSGPEKIEIINTFSLNLKLSGSSAPQPEGKMSAPLSAKRYFQVVSPVWLLSY